MSAEMSASRKQAVRNLTGMKRMRGSCLMSMAKLLCRVWGTVYKEDLGRKDQQVGSSRVRPSGKESAAASVTSIPWSVLAFCMIFLGTGYLWFAMGLSDVFGDKDQLPNESYLWLAALILGFVQGYPWLWGF